MAATPRAAESPTSYYTSKYSGEEIDAILDSITGGAAPPTTPPEGETPSTPSGSGSQGPWSRRNLLENWFFPDPVNQRRETSYSSNGHSLDRWYLGGGGGSFSLGADGISLSAAIIEQWVDNAWEIDRTFCFSVLVKGGTCELRIQDGSNSTIYASGSETVDGLGVVSITATVPAGRSLGVWIIGTFTLIAAKLEFGDDQTLAYQNSDGEWVLKDSPPDKTLELLKCQRYYVKPEPYDGICVNGFYDKKYGKVYFDIPLPVAMRTKPKTIGSSFGTVYFADGSSVKMTDPSVYNDEDDMTRVKLYTSITTDAPGGPVVLYGLNVAFSAER